MKKLLLGLLAIVMCFTLAGCGGNGGSGGSDKPANKLESQSDLMNFATNMAASYKDTKDKDSAFSSKISDLNILATVEANITMKPKSVFENGTLEDEKYVYSPSGTGTYTAEYDSATMSIKIVYVYSGETITTEAVYKDGYYYVQVRTEDSWVNDTIRWKFNGSKGDASYKDGASDSIYKTSPSSDFIK